MIEFLVIGYGNDLRSDDGAGRAVATSIEGWGLEGVEAIAVHQLTPELSIEIGRSRRIVFVDADVAIDGVRVQPIEARPGGLGSFTHHTDPSTLLALTEAVGAAPTAAFLVTIPATNLDFGSSFSPATEAGVHQAVELIAGLVDDDRPPLDGS